MADPDGIHFGTYLKDRRGKLDPSAFGFSSRRRRTPGLRREEVAQRAHVSATWYTCLEQGRGGPPSEEVLERLARALMLTPVEREHLFMLALQRPPKVDYNPSHAITPQLQRVLDSLLHSPAIVKTATWDIVAWNRAAACVLVDYATLPPDERNALRVLFLNPTVREAMVNWLEYARFSVAVFRADVARKGASHSVDTFVDALRRLSSDFDTIWREQDVRRLDEGLKRFTHPAAGSIELGYSSFSVDNRPDLALVVYTPIGPTDLARVRSIIAGADQAA